MTVQPVPTVTLGGALVAAGRAPDGTWPAAPIALDGLSVKWGRSKALDQPTPATAEVRLFDPTGVWLAGQPRLIGTRLDLSWAAGATSRTMFTGRITAAEVEPHVVMLDNTRTEGALITLSASSILTDLGNRYPPETSWPAETLAARRTRIINLCAGPVTSITTRATWDAAPLAALDPSKTSALDHLKTLYDNCGADRYTYDPTTRGVSFLARRSFPTAASVAHLQRDSTRSGVYITAPGGQLDGGRIAATGPASRGIDSAITRVVLTYTVGTGTAQVTVPLSGVDESVAGVRAASVTTGHTDASQATAAANDLAALAGGEATGWTVAALRWNTAGRGFDDIGQALRLIGGAETADVVFLARAWLSALGILPVFGIMGGTITYTGTAWTVQWTNAPVSVTAPGAALGWDDLDPSLVWDDMPGPATFDDSVTYDDLGMITTPTITIGA